jgi:uncharacterized membrane protein
VTSPLLRTATLMGATITMGLIAGVFALFAHTIMPGLRQTDDRTFVAAFQHIDRAIINPWFMITAFAGALVLSLAAGIANRGSTALPWIAAAFGLYLVAVIVTVAVNVPLNDAIKAAGNPSHIDVAQVRAQFHDPLGRLEPAARGHHDRSLRPARLGTRAQRPGELTAGGRNASGRARGRGAGRSRIPVQDSARRAGTAGARPGALVMRETFIQDAGRLRLRHREHVQGSE